MASNKQAKTLPKPRNSNDADLDVVSPDHKEPELRRSRRLQNSPPRRNTSESFAEDDIVSQKDQDGDNLSEQNSSLQDKRSRKKKPMSTFFLTVYMKEIIEETEDGNFLCLKCKDHDPIQRQSVFRHIL